MNRFAFMALFVGLSVWSSINVACVVYQLLFGTMSLLFIELLIWMTLSMAFFVMKGIESKQNQSDRRDLVFHLLGYHDYRKYPALIK